MNKPGRFKAGRSTPIRAIVPNPEKLVRFVQIRLKLTVFSTGGSMHETHRKAAEQHELAAKAHRTAAEHNEKGDNAEGNWHAERALEYSDKAFRLAKEAHAKSGQIVTL
jgi:hypothetical protein